MSLGLGRQVKRDLLEILTMKETEIRVQFLLEASRPKSKPNGNSNFVISAFYIITC